jgi:hypothetical protein
MEKPAADEQLPVAASSQELAVSYCSAYHPISDTRPFETGQE